MKTSYFVLSLVAVTGMAMAQTAASKQAQSTPAAQTTQMAQPTQMKTATYKGVLVDLSCGATTASSTASAATTTTTSGATVAAQDSANRSASDSASSCPVSANSTQFGMKLDGGQTVRFDLVGNQRAQDALKSDKHWSSDVAGGKPIHAKVIGVLSGDKLIVSSIH